MLVEFFDGLVVLRNVFFVGILRFLWFWFSFGDVTLVGRKMKKYGILWEF